LQGKILVDGENQMNDEELVVLTVQLGLDDGDAEELDHLTRQLLGELQQHEVESADLVVSGPAETGTKAADPVTIGAIALAVLPSVVPKIVEFLQQWSLRRSGRTVKFKGNIGGQDIEFEGFQQDLQQILAALSSQK
jgi:hypothetical protein